MKLKLNQSLRLALMGCYALAAPVATTITTGALVTGVTLTLLASQAQAAAIDIEGDASSLWATGGVDDTLYVNLEGYLTSAGFTTTAGTMVIFEMTIDDGYSTVSNGGKYTFNSVLRDATTAELRAEYAISDDVADADVLTAAKAAGYTGGIHFTKTGVTDQIYVFSDSMSDFSGDITAVANSNLALQFTGTTGRTNASGTGNISLAGSSTYPTQTYITYSIAGDSTVTNGSIEAPIITFANTGTYTVSSNITATDFNVTDSATVKLSGASTLENLTLAAGTNLSVISGGSLTLTGTTENAGTLSNAGTLTLGGTINNTGTLTNAGDLTITGAYAFTNDNTITNTGGTINFGAGALLDITGITGWAESDGTYSYTLINGGTVTLDDSFISDITSLFTDASLVGKGTITFVDGVISYTDPDGFIITGGTPDLQVGTVVGGVAFADGESITFTTDDATVNLTGNIAPSEFSIAAGIGVTLGSEDNYTLSTSSINMGAGSTLIVDVAVLAEGSQFGVTAADSTLIYDLNGVTLTDDTRIDGFTGELVIRDGDFIANTAMEGKMDFTSLTVESGSSFALVNASLNGEAYIGVKLNGGDVASESATLSGGGANGSSFKANVTLSGYTTLEATGVFNITGSISNEYGSAGVLNKTGTGTLSFGGDVNYTGDFNIQEGSVVLNSTSASFADITMASDTSLTVNKAASVTSLSSTTGGATLNATEALTIGGYSITGSGIMLNEGASMTSTSISNISGGALTTTSNTSINFTGSNTLTGINAIAAASETDATLTIDAGASLHITGTGNSNTSGLTVGGSTTGIAIVNVNGNLTVDGQLRTLIGTSGGVTGGAQISVNSGGTLTLNSGFATDSLHGQTQSKWRLVVNVEDGAKVAVGNQSDGTDYNNELTLTMKNGSTITDNGTDGGVTVDTTLNYADNATVNFVGSAADADAGTAAGSLTMASGIDADTVTANISGKVEFAGGATLKTIDVAASSSLTISSAVTTATLVNAGAVTVGTDGTLSMNSATGSGTLTLAGGTLIASTDRLDTNISVTNDSSLASSGTDALTLNSTIMLEENCQLDFTNAGTVSLDTGFELDISGWTIDTDESYTVFTGLSSDLSLDANWEVSEPGYNTTDYEIKWTYTEGKLTASFTPVSSAPTDSEWNSSTGNYEIGTNADSDSNLSIDTSDTNASTTNPQILTGNTNEGVTTTGTVDITGGTAVTITGANDLESSTITIGTDTDATNVTISTGVSATESMDVKGGSTVYVDDSGSISNTTINLGTADGATGTVEAGLITVSAQGGSVVDATLTSSLLTGGTVKGANITVNYTVNRIAATGGSFNGTKFTEKSSITLANYAQLTMTDVVIGSDTTFTAADYNTITFANGNTIYADTTNSSLTIGTVDNPATGYAASSYTIDTFSSLTSTSTVTLDGWLNLKLSLTDAQFGVLAGYWANGDLFDIILDFGDATVDANELDGVTVYIMNSENSSQSYVLTAGDVTGTGAVVGSDGSSLVVTIPEPSTATLSLLALAGLLARRRRKA